MISEINITLFFVIHGKVVSYYDADRFNNDINQVCEIRSREKPSITPHCAILPDLYI